MSRTVGRRRAGLTVVATALCGGLLAAGAPHVRAEAATQTEQRAERGWSVAPDAVVRVYVPAGDVTVRAWDRDSVHLRGKLHVNASLFGGGARTHVKVGVEARSQENGTLPRASLEVFVPRRARLWVKMIDGTMAISGTQVELEAYTVRGRVDIADAHGSTSIESIDAPVRLSQATGDVRIRGSRADVLLERVQGLASISTVSGAVVLRRSPIEGRVETVGGDISLEGVRIGGSLVAQSHAGNIVLHIPATDRPRLTAWARGRAVPGVDGTGQTRRGAIEARSFKGSVTLTDRR